MAKATKKPEFIGKSVAAFDLDNSADPNTIIAPTRSVNALPRIAMTAEIMIPTERGNGHRLR